MVIDEKDLKFSTFTGFELDSLRLFHEQVEKIINSRIIKNEALKGSVHIEMNGDGLKAEANFPDEDDLRSLLLLISPLVRTHERIRFEKILSILEYHSANNDTKSFLELLQKRYHASLESGLRYGANGKEYGDLDIFRLLLNGCHFHIDGDKRDELENLKPLPYAAEGALLGTLCVHVSWLKFVNRIIADRILALKE